MAKGEEKKSGGGDEKESKFPPGFRFVPTDEELVEYYLLPRLQGRAHVANDAIIEADVYQCHPDKLINEMYEDKGEDSWYFLSPRYRKYRNGDRPSRSTDDNRGRWKASTGKSEAKEAVGDGKIKFHESVLAYFEGPIKTEKKTKWLMHELNVPQFENKLDKNGGRSSDSKTLDDYVMCRIYVTPRHKGNDDEAGPSVACPPPQPGPVESGQGAAGRELSARQAGKRPVEEQPPGVPATPPKRARAPALQLEAPAQLYGGGMQIRFKTTAYYGGTGPPMLYNAHTSMPRPPPVALNGQVLPCRTAASPSSFGQTMMMPPSNPVGKAVTPPSIVPRSPQEQQQQLETEEIRKKRAYQQHMDGWMRATMQPTGYAPYATQQPQLTAFTQQQQQRYLSAYVNHHHMGGMVPLFPRYDCHSFDVGQQYQCGGAVPTASDSGGATTLVAATAEASMFGATNEATVGGDCNNDDQKPVWSWRLKTSPDGKSSANCDGPRNDSPD